MCSTAAQRIAEIGQAIDDLAAQAWPTPKGEPADANAGAAADADAIAAKTTQAGPAPADADPLVARVAELWALLAELDPEMGRRLAGYQNLSAPTDLRSAHRPGGLRAARTLSNPAYSLVVPTLGLARSPNPSAGPSMVQ